MSTSKASGSPRGRGPHCTGVPLANAPFHLKGDDLTAWNQWRDVLLRSPEYSDALQEEGDVEPFTDPTGFDIQEPTLPLGGNWTSEGAFPSGQGARPRSECSS